MRTDGEASVCNQLKSFGSYSVVFLLRFATPCKFNHKITMANYLNKVKFNNKIGRRARPDS